VPGNQRGRLAVADQAVVRDGRVGVPWHGVK
jgi:hypothetical protein